MNRKDIEDLRVALLRTQVELLALKDRIEKLEANENDRRKNEYVFVNAIGLER